VGPGKRGRDLIRRSGKKDQNRRALGPLRAIVSLLAKENSSYIDRLKKGRVKTPQAWRKKGKRWPKSLEERG